MTSEMLKNQKNVCFILWGALTASTLIYAMLIFTEMMGPYTSSTKENYFYPVLSMAILLSVSSIFYFKSITSKEGIQKVVRSIDLKNPPQISGTIDLNEFNNLSDDEKIKLFAFSKLFPQLILCWAFFDLTVILGLVAYNIRMLPNGNYFWIFFSIGFVSLLLTIPRFLNSFVSSQRVSSTS